MNDQKMPSARLPFGMATAVRLKPILSRSLTPHVRRPLSAEQHVRMTAAAL